MIEKIRANKKPIIQCAIGFGALIVFVVLYTWLVPGWWAPM